MNASFFEPRLRRPHPGRLFCWRIGSQGFRPELPTKTPPKPTTATSCRARRSPELWRAQLRFLEPRVVKLKGRKFSTFGPV